MRLRFLPALIPFVAAAVIYMKMTAQAAPPLVEYLKKSDPAYDWKVASSSELPNGVRLTELDLTSQKWQGITWKHRLSVLQPQEMRKNPTGLLFVTGNYNPNEARFLAPIAAAVKQPLFVLYDVPNQPLFDGLNEDALISYTFQKYMETEDATWPLLFPMTKSAHRAMDAAQAFAQKEWDTKLNGFVVSGASKRGWTTWLTGATDKRVKGIAPMVYDNLNLGPQMEHQIRTWGKFSEEIADYSEKGLPELMNTEKGKRLAAMVDPYTFRKEIRIPKLIINGTNDAYWPLDAAAFYYDDLRGPKNLLYVPNAGHGLEDRMRVARTLTAFWNRVSAGGRLPAFPRSIHRSFRKRPGEKGLMTVVVEPHQLTKEMRLWWSVSDDKDFRDAKWTSRQMLREGREYRAVMDTPTDGYLATFAEAGYEGETGPYTLSSPVQIQSLR